MLTATVSRERANTQSYAQFDPALAWIEANAPTDTRIGLAGTWSTERVSPALPAFGRRLGNEVRFVGPFEQHMLRQYRSEPAFAAAASRYDVLVIGRGAPPEPEAQEEAWAARAGFEPVAESDRLAVLARLSSDG